jgi:hypothetical protein
MSSQSELQTIVSEFGHQLVTVRRQWNDWRKAVYRFHAIENVHWSDVSGGVNAHANREYLHGYVWCDKMVSGDLAHSCMHGKVPHRIKVCIVQIDNTKPIHQALKRSVEITI